MSRGGGSSRQNINSVFYAESYHPIQAGSIDGIDILPHDNAIYRALLCSSAGLYDPFGDPKVTGDPYCSLFVGRLSHLTTEDSLHKAMSRYGRVKSLRLVRHIVTGASRGYAFVEYENEKEMRRAYEEAHHSRVDDCEILVDYNRQQLMPGWIPRRLGGGLGGMKGSGQLRFGGRERPFRAPLKSIPFDDLKRLGIPPPPEGRYMTLYQVPPPPRRRRNSVDREEEYSHSRRRRSSVDKEEEYSHSSRRRSTSRNRPTEREEISVDREENHSHKHSKHTHPSSRRRSTSRDHLTEREENSVDREENYSQSHRRSKNTHRSSRRRSTSRDHLTDHEEKRSPSN